MDPTLEQRTDEAIATLELDLVDQTQRGKIIDVLREWQSREEMMRNNPPAT